VRRALWLFLAACTGSGETALLNEVKATLAEREARLSAYAFRAQSNGVSYAVSFRAPKSTRLELEQGALSFDGERFYERDDAARTFTVYAPRLTPAELALVWSQSFGARVPEGFRAPLLPPRGVTATRVGDTVELTLRTTDEGKQVSVTSVLRWPGGDFLERRTDYGGAKGALRMETQQCDEKLRLCVPTRLTKWAGAERVEETVLSDVQLGASEPREHFVLSTPAGFSLATSELVPVR
jgi:hypothetical protein